MNWETVWGTPAPADAPAADQVGVFGAATVSAGKFDPVPTVTVAGVVVATGGPEAIDAGLLAVDTVAIDWGRDEVLAQPDPATGRLTLFDATNAWATREDRRGLTVTIGWAGTPPGGTPAAGMFLRGRIGSPIRVSRRTVLHPVTGEPVDGSLVELRLQSILVDLANYVTHTGWPVETMGGRTDRIASLAGNIAGVLTGGINVRSFWRTPNVAAIAAQDQPSLLDSLTAVYDSAGQDRMTYLPATDRAEFVPRRDYPSQRGMAGLWWDGTDGNRARGGQGAYLRSYALALPGAAAGVPCYLDSAALEYDPADGITSPPRITRVSLTHPDEGAAYADRQVEAVVRSEDGQPVDELVTGMRTARVESLVAWNAYADTALSDLEFIVRREGSRWTLEPLALNTRKVGGFETLEAAQVLLAGSEGTSLVFLQRSWLPMYGIRPIFGVMGGTIAYRAGGWELAIVLAPITTTPAQHAISWSEIDDGSATYELQWWDADHPRGLHESLTYEDMAYCATGLGVTTIAPDTGWDTPLS